MGKQSSYDEITVPDGNADFVVGYRAGAAARANRWSFATLRDWALGGITWLSGGGRTSAGQARTDLGLGDAATKNTSEFIPGGAIYGPTGTPPGSPENGTLCVITGLFDKNFGDVVTGSEGGSATYLCVYDTTRGWKVC